MGTVFPGDERAHGALGLALLRLEPVGRRLGAPWLHCRAVTAGRSESAIRCHGLDEVRNIEEGNPDRFLASRRFTGHAFGMWAGHVSGTERNGATIHLSPFELH